MPLKFMAAKRLAGHPVTPHRWEIDELLWSALRFIFPSIDVCRLTYLQLTVPHTTPNLISPNISYSTLVGITAIRSLCIVPVLDVKYFFLSLRNTTRKIFAGKQAA